MKENRFFIGIDISSESFTACCINEDLEPIFPVENFSNTPEGFEKFTTVIHHHRLPSKRVLLSLEATGVYSETLCYLLGSKGYSITLVDPRTVKGPHRILPEKMIPWTL